MLLDPPVVQQSAGPARRGRPSAKSASSRRWHRHHRLSAHITTVRSAPAWASTSSTAAWKPSVRMRARRSRGTCPRARRCRVSRGRASGSRRAACPSGRRSGLGQPAFQLGARHVRVAAAAGRGPDVDQHGHVRRPGAAPSSARPCSPVPERQQHVITILRRPAWLSRSPVGSARRREPGGGRRPVVEPARTAPAGSDVLRRFRDRGARRIACSSCTGVSPSPRHPAPSGARVRARRARCVEPSLELEHDWKHPG